MAYLLGIDTGGTFTDAVLVRDGDHRVLASAKSPTTHHDLALGIGAAVERVLADAGGSAGSDVALASVSTTLATNALVEGHGDPVGLISLGFDRAELERVGVLGVVDTAHVAVLDGGHDAHGNERIDFPEAQVAATVDRLAEHVSAFAVTGRFSVRNPAHELRVGELVRERTGLPVTMSSELSARLDGPRRALTAALNARLLATIARLNRAVLLVLDANGIDAPVMVVRGDGSLVSQQFASARPIETVLSGPAASVIGAVHLAGAVDAAAADRSVIVDIGGTTTDLAVIADGRPAVTEQGAVVGGHRTMIHAVDMATIGLGGDSEVRIDTRDPAGPVLLGPERALPLGSLVGEHPHLLDELERQLAAPTGQLGHARFLVAVGAEDRGALDSRERRVLDRLAGGPIAESAAVKSSIDARVVARLRARGVVRVATFTPTDAHAVLAGTGDMVAMVAPGFSARAGELGAELIARQTSPSGGAIASGAESMARLVVDLLVRRSAGFALCSALAADGIAADADDPVLQAALDHRRGVADVAVSLGVPLVAIGAPAATCYPSVGELVRTPVVVPEHGPVANAIGAVVGQVRIARSCTITQPTKGQFRAHLDDQPTFGSVDNARAEASRRLGDAVLADADAAGAADPVLSERWSERTAVINEKTVFVEGTLTVEATGRPRL